MRESKSIRWGILACGKIAHTFARALKEASACELQAVAARDADRAQAFAQEHGAVRAYGSYEGLLADPDVDAIYIATIHPQHLQWMLAAFQAGKHVLCEKPITMNLREAKMAHKIARERACLLREAFMYRHHPQTQTVVDLVESGRIGHVRMVEAEFCFNAGVDVTSRLQDKALGGGGILDVGCYPMSFVRLIAGRAQGRLFAEPLELKAVGHLDMETKTDMWTTASMRFEGDVLAKCTCAVRLAAENRAVIYGDSGRLIVTKPWFAEGEIRIQANDASDVEVVSTRDDRNLYVYEIESFVGELQGRPLGMKEVGMRIDDTLGNMKALDWWRSEIGLAYEADRPA